TKVPEMTRATLKAGEERRAPSPVALLPVALYMGADPPTATTRPRPDMTLRLYDTLTREKRAFEPVDPARVTMYVCGPTAYHYAHIGNARPVVVFDVLFRLLRHIDGPEAVVYAANVTDVDDKINAKAAAEGVPISTITER